MSNDLARRPKVLLNATRSQLKWLRDDGYVEARIIEKRSGYTLRFDGSHGAVWISVDVARGRVEVLLAPRGTTVYEAIPIERVNTAFARAITDVQSGDSDRADVAVTLGRYLDALKDRRDHELAGDWSEFDRAKAGGGDGGVAHNAAVAKVKRIIEPES
jgi:hypothetical protein